MNVTLKKCEGTSNGRESGLATSMKRKTASVKVHKSEILNV
jgi:hypothetical protein